MRRQPLALSVPRRPGAELTGTGRIIRGAGRNIIRAVGWSVLRAAVERIVRGVERVRSRGLAMAVIQLENVALPRMVFGGCRTSHVAAGYDPLAAGLAYYITGLQPQATTSFGKPPAPEHLIRAADGEAHPIPSSASAPESRPFAPNLQQFPTSADAHQFAMAEEDGQELITKPFKFVTGRPDNPSL